MERKECNNIIGIDLGTTYSCVAVLIGDKIETIGDDNGKKTIASCVAFHETELLVGNIAKDLYYKNPANTIFDAKRLIGSKYSDAIVQRNGRLWPFKVSEGEDKQAMFSVTFKGEEKRFGPAEISSIVLRRLRQLAEDYLKSSVKNAVIAVPAYFNDSQRQATKAAAILAGLNVMRIINEPSAVAFAYCYNKGISTAKKNVLVFDLGGGTLDVTLLTILQGSLDVKSTAGDRYLGGEDFVNRLVHHYIREIEKKLNKNILGDPEALSDLRRTCEKVKRKLSFTTSYPFRLRAGRDIDFTSTITRSLFEEINEDLFIKCLCYVQQCLRDGGMHKRDVNEIVLAGGSSRIPKIQQLLGEFFGSEKICKTSEPELMVAHGAAIYAGVLSGKNVKFFRSLSDTNPLSIGLETGQGEMTVLIPRNTKIPIKKRFDIPVHYFYEEGEANQGGFCRIRIYEGESTKTADNYLLGKFTLSNIPDIANSKIEVCLEINVDGILTVSAIEKSNGQKNEIIISNETRTISKEEVEKLFLEAERSKFEAEKQKKMERVLENYSYNINEALRDGKIRDKVDPNDKLKIENSVKEIQEWLQSNKLADEEEFEKKIMWLQKYICYPIVYKHYHPMEKNTSSCNFSISELKIENHKHSLIPEHATSFHKCNSCLDPVFKHQPCYSCKKNCNFHIHEVCAFASPSATHPFLSDCEFKFQGNLSKDKPIELLFCEACGKTVQGSYYQCGQHQPAHALHPCCLNLDRAVVVGTDMILHLTNRVFSKCMRCNNEEVGPGICGWSYTTTDGRYGYHVACVKNMIKKIIEKSEEDDQGAETTSTGGDGKSKKSFRESKTYICMMRGLRIACILIELFIGVDLEIDKFIDSIVDLFFE